MIRYAQFAAFLGFALTISLLAGYYAMLRLFWMFGLATGPFFWLAVVAAALLFIAGMGLSAISDNPTPGWPGRPSSRSPRCWRPPGRPTPE